MKNVKNVKNVKNLKNVKNVYFYDNFQIGVSEFREKFEKNEIRNSPENHSN